METTTRPVRRSSKVNGPDRFGTYSVECLHTGEILMAGLSLLGAVHASVRTLGLDPGRVRFGDMPRLFPAMEAYAGRSLADLRARTELHS